ncbi:hypothetical protein JM84_0677 [Dokdonia sp. Hel_I_63]|uniref:hypothetical protein n=1 Tax=Dokdonia sp. Hel_I_63 TaxID=1249996 RepID=UPI00119BBC2D|nr:hypothetical protein [Dokdonia sp. Hel_I_63]TVZ21797.1 hypothetical protein JM84_0677 [Dokdonia sp. Hel_I_63]
MKILKLLFCIFLFYSCSSKIKIIDIHKTTDNENLKKNYYLKDKNRSFERLSGKWLWSNNIDSLIIEATPFYKKRRQSPVRDYENVFYDTCILNVKYVKKGETIIDNIGPSKGDSCLVVSPFKVQTNVFYLKNRCQKDNGSYLALRGDNEQLFFISPYVKQERVLVKKEGEYEVVIPHSIVLDRVMQ